ncbi:MULTISPECIES: hypothetical protein [Micromonospora]|uniref:Uncharacterized protein n=1 Tax=Micromonospora solifontis TaxID=2487138 RepID=A0ABX9WMX3_9ACTN|nr:MULTISPECIES: hypothetical protein [Micromonospora]NES15574.1 hypothetical protein [Micromonospora sp. PPF5-17B]NES35921.1 hypothetical protein [Micromonospora solifontis]NES56891.1 hypothetical protein [Micromonospora sp. PPF5-6]RNM00206.1 hypothetical protein EFE23_07045 [Micromonospora solifontis]
MRQEEQQSIQDRADAVRSEPVPVPPPGAEADGHRRDRGDRADVPEDALDDRGTFDDPAVVGEGGDHRRADPGDGRDGYDARDVRDAEAADAGETGRTEYHDPAPLPTAFGATTVGDAVAASAMASGRPEDERDPRGEDTAVPGDGAPGRTDAFDAERADPTAGDRLHDPDRWAAEQSGAARDDAPEAGATGYGSAEPEMVDPDASTAAAGASVAGSTAGASAAGMADAAAPGARPTPGAVPADAATLFAPEAAQSFRDRWRDVQLRFVDDPKAAVGEAQALVDEAMEALATALREQKSKLGGWQESGSADTEQLRMAVRGYRDFLDRVLGR